MPLVKAKGKGKKAKNAAVGKNIRELKKANKTKVLGKKRPMRQIKAAVIHAAYDE